MEDFPTIIDKTENFVTDMLLTLPETMMYHNLNHTCEVVKATENIGAYASLSEEEKEIVILSAWFHDTGFKFVYDNHEEKSISIAREFLNQNNYPAEKVEKVAACIQSTKTGQVPGSLSERVLHDADFIHLSKKSYFDKLLLLKRELEQAKGGKLIDAEWYKQNLEFLRVHRYYTEYGKVVLEPKVEINRAKQFKMLKKLGRMQDQVISKDLNLDPEKIKELKKKLKKVEGRPDRGIETMFRLTSRNHLQLSAMADNKANILISVNAIIISIIIGGLMKSLDSHDHLVIPTYLILAINVVTIVLSIMVLRPNVTKGKFTRKDIEEKNTNLLFFGNFHGMTRIDYKWGMVEMMNDSKFLYSSLIDDIYFLGKVLGKKYKYLRLSYNFFMYGIILAVIAYVIANINYVKNMGI